MTISSETLSEYESLISELTTYTRGHGAFGESEKYPPLPVQIKAATAIKRLIGIIQNEQHKESS